MLLLGGKVVDSMAGLFRAYGQIRRGSDPWRTPFLIPVGDLLPPLIQGSSNVAIDVGSAAPDLRFALVAQSLDAFPNIRVQVKVRPLPGRVLSDISIRVVLLMSADSPFLDSGPLEQGAKFAVLQHRTGPGATFPLQLLIDVTVSGGMLVVADTSLTGDFVPAPVPGVIRADRTLISARDERGPSGGGAVLDVSGGIVTDDMVHLAGVETDYNSILNTGYVEGPRQIRGIPLDWVEDSTAAKPPSATWVEAVATGSTASPTELLVRIDTPTTGDAPQDPPTVDLTPGGSLRPGSYRYRTTWLHANGAESAGGPRSSPVTVAGADKSVHVSDLEPAPAPPAPDPTAIAVTKRRIYRTDPDTAPAADPERGDRGDDVLVAELDPAQTTFDDTGDDGGPFDPSAAPRLRTDYLGLYYQAPIHFDVAGSIRMIDGADDESYTASIQHAPTALRVVYRPGSEPLLSVAADGPTAGIAASIPVLSTPLGDGLELEVAGVPDRLAAHWEILGSEHFGLSIVGAASTLDPGAVMDDADAIGRIGVRLGGISPPAPWPVGEADVAVELGADPAADPEALIALTVLRRAALRSGARIWADRDAEQGVMDIVARFSDMLTTRKRVTDRTLRIARRSAGEDPLTDLAVTGHHLSDEVRARLELADPGATRVALEGRARFLRGHLLANLKPDGGGTATTLDADIFIDDTTEKLGVDLGPPIELQLAWPVRAGGTARIGGGVPEPIKVWPDLIVPGSATVTTDWPIGADLAEPGLSGRVAAAFGDAAPIAARSTPQVKLLSNGPAEPSTGLRAATARVLAVADAEVPESVTQIAEVAAVLDIEPQLGFYARANSARRVEALEAESRVAYPLDLRAPEGARSWLRARTAHLPGRLTPLLRMVGGEPAGAELVSSEAWGEGVVWAEPSFAWDEHTDELGTDRGIGLITAGWAGMPPRVEAWRLDKGDALDGKVPAADRLPSLGGPGSRDRDAGGALIRLDGDLLLNHVQVAMPSGGAERTCLNGDTPTGTGPDIALQSRTPVHHGKWVEVISPFVELRPSGGLREAVLWMATGPPADDTDDTDDTGPELDPCTETAPEPPDADDGLGWRIQDDLELTMALRLYELVTPSGLLDPAPRWWSMPSRAERWNCTLIMIPDSSGSSPPNPPTYVWACRGSPDRGLGAAGGAADEGLRQFRGRPLPEGGDQQPLRRLGGRQRQLVVAPAGSAGDPAVHLLRTDDLLGRCLHGQRQRRLPPDRRDLLVAPSDLLLELSMIVDRLVVHHTYLGPTVVDVSGNHNHGHLESVASGGGHVIFQGGPDTVRVMRSATLDEMRAIRTTVRFKVHPQPFGIDPWYSGGPRRMNLIEGYLSFALVIDPDRSLHGTIVDGTGAWNGASSAPGVVSYGVWHEATFVHDGFSACRVDLDGVTVAESLDVLGPARPPKDPYGIAIGHWPDPDDRYTFVGEIAEVRIWIDRLDADDYFDDCCIDREKVDELFDDLRGRGSDDPDFDPDAYNESAEAIRKIGTSNFGVLASGGDADREHAWDMARRLLVGLRGGHQGSLVDTLLDAGTELAARRSAADLQADGDALADAVDHTPIGPLLRPLLAGASGAELEAIRRRAGLDEWLEAFCFGWAVPEPGDRDEKPHDDPDKPGRHEDPPEDPTDRDQGERPPSWGSDGPHRDDVRKTRTTGPDRRGEQDDPDRGEVPRRARPPVLTGAALP